MKKPVMTSLDAIQFAEMGRSWPGKRGDLSPLEAYAAENSAKSGAVKGNLARTLAVLTAPSAVVELIFARENNPQTCRLYTAGDGTAAGILEDADGQITLCPPSSVSQMAQEFSVRLAENGQESAAFDANLSAKEAWVLGMMLDLQRQAALMAAAQTGSLKVDIAPIFSQTTLIWQVLSAISDPQNSNRALGVLADEPAWVTLFCLCSELQPEVLSQEDVNGILTSLATNGLAVQRADSFALAEKVAQFANHFLFPGGMVFLKAGRENEGSVKEELLTCLHDGKTFLYILSAPEAAEKVNMLGGSYELLTKTIAMALEKPLSLYTLMGLEERVEAKPATGLTCANCGKPVNPGSGFCGNCGKPTARAEMVQGIRACPRCGNPASLNARFCPNCGGPM